MKNNKKASGNNKSQRKKTTIFLVIIVIFLIKIYIQHYENKYKQKECCNCFHLFCTSIVLDEQTCEL